jgi:hypothetical protein
MHWLFFESSAFWIKTLIVLRCTWGSSIWSCGRHPFIDPNQTPFFHVPESLPSITWIYLPHHSKFWSYQFLILLKTIYEENLKHSSCKIDIQADFQCYSQISYWRHWPLRCCCRCMLEIRTILSLITYQWRFFCRLAHGTSFLNVFTVCISDATFCRF